MISSRLGDDGGRELFFVCMETPALISGFESGTPLVGDGFRGIAGVTLDLSTGGTCGDDLRDVEVESRIEA